MEATIIMIFDDTQVIEIYENNNSKFDAKLCDSMGEYHAIVKRISKENVSVTLEGAWKNRIMTIEYAKWDFDKIWSDLAAQGVIVKALA